MYSHSNICSLMLNFQICKLVENMIPVLDERESIANNPLLNDSIQLQKQNEAMGDRGVMIHSTWLTCIYFQRIVTYEEFISPLSLDQKSALLDALLEYARKTHRYCIYCGCDYESMLSNVNMSQELTLADEEFTKYCPGKYEDDHWD